MTYEALQLTTAEAAEALVLEARRETKPLMRENVLAAFDIVAARLVDGGAAALVETATSYYEAQGRAAPAAALEELAQIASLFDRGAWERRLAAELVRAGSFAEPWEAPADDRILSDRPLGVVLHVAAGNGLAAGLESALCGLLAGNRNILRLSSQTPPVAAQLAAMLHEAGLEPAALAVVRWRAGDAAVEDAFKACVDGIVVWGGAEVVQAYRENLPPGVRLLEFGPKLGVAVVTAAGRARDGLYDGLARDVFAYDQVSCASPQVLLVEVADGEDAELVAEGVMARCAAAFDRRIAGGDVIVRDDDASVESLKAMERAKLLAARGEARWLARYPQWLLVDRRDEAPLEPSPLQRTLTMVRCKGAAGVEDYLSPVRRYLQTVSLLAGEEEVDRWSERLWNAGATRVVAAGRATLPMEGAPHDGGFLITSLLRTTSLEHPARRARVASADPAATESRLSRLVAVAGRAPFYRERFAAAGLEGAFSLEAFQRMPLLEKHDLHRNAPPTSERMLTQPLASAPGSYLFTTGGSTSEPRYALYTQEEWLEATELFARAFRSSGITREDRMLNLFQGGGLWSAFLATNRGIELAAGLNLSVGSSMDPEQVLDVAGKFGATASFGLPTTYLRLAEAASRNRRGARLKTVLYAGEHMGKDAALYVKEALGADVVRSSLYAAVDAGCIGYQCRHAAQGVHHALERYAYVEIVDPVTGEPVAPGVEGDLVVTSLSRRLYPIVRLRTGDRGRQVVSPCACGTHAMTFELLGRSDDMIRVASANVFVSDVERLCAASGGYLSPIFQIVVSRIGVEDSLRLILEANEDGLSNAEIEAKREEARKTYLALAEDVRETFESGALRHVKLDFVAPGTIKGNWKTGKTKRLIDERG